MNGSHPGWSSDHRPDHSSSSSDHMMTVRHIATVSVSDGENNVAVYVVYLCKYGGDRSLYTGGVPAISDIHLQRHTMDLIEIPATQWTLLHPIRGQHTHPLHVSRGRRVLSTYLIQGSPVCPSNSVLRLLLISPAASVYGVFSLPPRLSDLGAPPCGDRCTVQASRQ